MPECKYTHHSVADTFDKVKADLLLKAFGIWPFGDLGKDAAKKDKDKASGTTE